MSGVSGCRVSEFWGLGFGVGLEPTFRVFGEEHQGS